MLGSDRLHRVQTMHLQHVLKPETLVVLTFPSELCSIRKRRRAQTPHLHAVYHLLYRKLKPGRQPTEYNSSWNVYQLGGCFPQCPG